MVEKEISNSEESGAHNPTKILKERLTQVIKELAESPPLSKDLVKEKLLQFVRELIKQEDGLSHLYQLTPKIVEAGFFSGGGWEREDKLLPELVRGSFLAGGLYPLIEIISELRLLCMANGRLESRYLTKEEAKTFLTEVMALNLDILFDTITEENRIYAPQFKVARDLLDYLAEGLDIEDLFDEYSQEVLVLAYQRPIITDHISALVESGMALVEKSEKLRERQSFADLELFFKSVYGPTPHSSDCDHPLDYRKKVKELDLSELEKEALNFGVLLKETGLGNIYGVILVRHLVRKAPELIALALGLNDSGRAHFEEHRELVLNIIRMAIRPSTANSLYGLTCFLERHLLSQSAVLNGLTKLVNSQVAPSVAERLLKRKKYNDSITPNAIIISGLISVLGQPLGIGQGKNPTCQAARALSLWSQYNPGYLIDVVITAFHSDVIEMNFEGSLLKSSDYLNTSAINFDPELDPVSLLLVPHLNVIYGEMLRRSAARGEDPHKWANPGLYGRIVNFGFESVLDVFQTHVKDFENFVRRFYSTHHPEYSDGTKLTYANPVGIFITNSHGTLIGLHAVSIQRVAEDEKGQMRVYFFNPNNEGRQNWGQGIRPTVYGHNEIKGESSLPFDHFTARLYAYHFNPYEEGDGFAVPESTIKKVVEMAKSSWGQSYEWR